MKTTMLAIAAALLLSYGCQDETDLFTEHSEADEIATEAMEEAFEGATLYNDSLVHCSETGNCSDAFIQYCDSLFHEFDEEYDHNHEAYSHNNSSDDHHHGATSEHHHGKIEHHEDEGEEHHGHSIESETEMQHLRELHKNYHP